MPEQQEDTITHEPEKQDNKIMANELMESMKQFQDKFLELETEKKESIKQLQDEMNFIKSEQNKGLWAKFKNLFVN